MNDKLSIRGTLWITGFGMAFTVVLSGVVATILTGQRTASVICLISGGILSAWAIFPIIIVHNKLALFSEEICIYIDKMMEDKVEIQRLFDQDTHLNRITFRLNRLYNSLQTAKVQSAKKHADLQSLLSDVAHQVKTPSTNLKLAVSALISGKLSSSDQQDYIHILKSQVEKLEFLMGAMVKSSRLETGIITPVKKNTALYETLAAAVGSVFPTAQKKQMKVIVSCPETLIIPHDSKWTAEALFNILDNAVKYTPSEGSIAILVEQWESYTKIDIEDNGRGIEESRQAAVFRRFYREPEVQDTDGIGIGLYLTRKIISKQGGYIKLTSRQGHGSVFSVFLPNFNSSVSL